MWLTARLRPRRQNWRPAPAEQPTHRKWGHGGRRISAQLVDETEAFLGGRFVERAEARGDFVPVWAWTNLLAHGSDKDLRAEQTIELRDRPERALQHPSHLAAVQKPSGHKPIGGSSDVGGSQKLGVHKRSTPTGSRRGRGGDSP
jgi:hypothetical protein